MDSLLKATFLVTVNIVAWILHGLCLYAMGAIDSLAAKAWLPGSELELFFRLVIVLVPVTLFLLVSHAVKPRNGIPIACLAPLAVCGLIAMIAAWQARYSAEGEAFAPFVLSSSLAVAGSLGLAYTLHSKVNLWFFARARPHPCACTTCGYDLIGLCGIVTCPECGEPVARGSIASVTAIRLGSVWIGLYIIVSAMAVLIVCGWSLGSAVLLVPVAFAASVVSYRIGGWCFGLSRAG